MKTLNIILLTTLMTGNVFAINTNGKMPPVPKPLSRIPQGILNLDDLENFANQNVEKQVQENEKGDTDKTAVDKEVSKSQKEGEKEIAKQDEEKDEDKPMAPEEKKDKKLEENLSGQKQVVQRHPSWERIIKEIEDATVTRVGKEKRSKHQEIKSEIEKFRKSSEELTTKVSNFENKQLADAQKQLAEAEEKLKKAQDELEMQKKVISGLKKSEELAASPYKGIPDEKIKKSLIEKATKEVRIKLDEVEKAKKESEENNKQLTKQKAKLVKALQEAKDKYKGLQQEQQDAQKKFHEFVQKEENFMGKHKHLQKLIIAEAQKQENLKNTMAELKKKFDSSDQKANLFFMDFDKLQEEYKDHDKYLAEVAGQYNDYLQKTLIGKFVNESIEKALAGQAERFEQLTKELNDSKEQVAALTKKLEEVKKAGVNTNGIACKAAKAIQQCMNAEEEIALNLEKGWEDSSDRSAVVKRRTPTIAPGQPTVKVQAAGE